MMWNDVPWAQIHLFEGKITWNWPPRGSWRLLELNSSPFDSISWVLGVRKTITSFWFSVGPLKLQQRIFLWKLLFLRPETAYEFYSHLYNPNFIDFGQILQKLWRFEDFGWKWNIYLFSWAKLMLTFAHFCSLIWT